MTHGRLSASILVMFHTLSLTSYRNVFTEMTFFTSDCSIWSIIIVFFFFFYKWCQGIQDNFLYLFFFNFYLFIYLFMAVLGLRSCARAFSSCGKRGPLFIAVRGPLTIAASLVAEHRLHTCKLSNCGSRAQLLCGMWDLPRPGLEPMSPALAGRFSTTAPPGKPP